MRVPKPVAAVAEEPAHHRRVNMYRELRCNAHVAQKYTHWLYVLSSPGIGRCVRERIAREILRRALLTRKLTFSRRAFYKTLSLAHIPHTHIHTHRTLRAANARRVFASRLIATLFNDALKLRAEFIRKLRGSSRQSLLRSSL